MEHHLRKSSGASFEGDERGGGFRQKGGYGKLYDLVELGRHLVWS